jgi:hypothetical protein
MRPGQLALAILLVGVGSADRAAASPLLPILTGVSVQSPLAIEAVRWRHRHHGRYFWGDRRGGDRDDTDRLALSFSGANRQTPPEFVRPDPRRRRGWVDPPAVR